MKRIIGIPVDVIIAIAITIAVLFVLGFIAAATDLPTIPLVAIPSIWAAWDSSRIQLRKYKSLISTSPLLLFLGLIILWIPIFPIYLVMRQRIKKGTAVLRDEYASQ